MTMNIHCLMVSENRVPVVGLAFASASAQQRRNVSLQLDVAIPLHQESEYAAAFQATARRGSDAPVTMVVRDRRKSVPESLHLLANAAALSGGLQCCTVWDDDDISHPTRLLKTASAIMAFHPEPVVTSYTRGWFVNARTLNGYLADLDYGSDTPPFWGGCLAWNHAAWKLSNGFWDCSSPGYDRAFVRFLLAHPCSHNIHFVPIEAEDNELPIALCHDKNIASRYQRPGDPMEEKLQGWLPHRVFAQLKGFQRFCVDQKIYPPLSDQ